MPKIHIKIKSFDIDHEKGITNVVWHHWDGSYFCAKCALSPKSGSVDGVKWDSVNEVRLAVSSKYYGINS